MTRKKIVYLLLVVLTIFIVGFSMTGEKDYTSTDLAELNKIVDLKISATSGRYEIFGTPESRSGLPAPTDYETLVAEFDISNPPISANKIPIAEVWLVPNASRPWLSEPFKSLLQKYRNARFPSNESGCEYFSAVPVGDTRPIHGFRCLSGSKMLVYFPLMTDRS